MTRQMAPVPAKPVERRPVSLGMPGALVLQRKCACGGSSTSGGDCEECKKKDGVLQRRAMNGSGAGIGEVPPIVHDVLRLPGETLPSGARSFFEPRVGRAAGSIRDGSVQGSSSAGLTVTDPGDSHEQE